jgi:hypothetical protein
MKIIALAALLPAIVMGLSACGAKPAPAIGQATVNSEHSSLRSKNSATSRTIKVMEPGDHVEILEQQDRWYRVRLGDIEGWMEVSTLVTDAMRKQIEAVSSSARDQKPQNTGTLREDANLRIEPGRSTSVLKRLSSQTQVEILERKTVARAASGTETAPRPDVWFKVRSGMNVGWLLASFVEFDVPEEIARYTEDFVYSTVRVVHQIEDPVAGTIKWYVVGERRPGMDPNLDFNGVRVFTWDARQLRYETAYRKRDLRGVYPLEVGDQGGKPMFRIHELGADGTTKTTREFVMYGVVVRETKKS